MCGGEGFECSTYGPVCPQLGTGCSDSGWLSMIGMFEMALHCFVKERVYPEPAVFAMYILVDEAKDAAVMLDAPCTEYKTCTWRRHAM